jgi:hypothetical protein
VYYRTPTVGWVTFSDLILTNEVIVTELTAGTSYTFVVKATNIYGNSLYQDGVTVLAADIPDAPTAPVITYSAPDLTISWTEPDNRGSSLLAYQIEIR